MPDDADRGLPGLPLMDTIRAVFVGLEGEVLDQKVIEYPPPLVVEVAFTKPLRALWEQGLTMDLYKVVEFHYHPAHEITEDGVESVALYIREGIG